MPEHRENILIIIEYQRVYITFQSWRVLFLPAAIKKFRGSYCENNFRERLYLMRINSLGHVTLVSKLIFNMTYFLEHCCVSLSFLSIIELSSCKINYRNFRNMKIIRTFIYFYVRLFYS